MIKENLKHENREDSFYLIVEFEKIHLSKLDLINLSNSITKQKDGRPCENVIVGSNNIKCELSRPNSQEAFVSIFVNDKNVCTTNNANAFETFANHGTLEMYNNSDF